MNVEVVILTKEIKATQNELPVIFCASENPSLVNRRSIQTVWEAISKWHHGGWGGVGGTIKEQKKI